MSKIIIGPGRMSFPALFEPAKNQDGTPGDKYQVTLLLPPDFDTGPMVEALNAAAAEKWGNDKSKWPKTLRGPKLVIRDASEKEHLAGYEPGWKFVALKTKNQPGIVDAMKNEITDPREVYAGRWARVSARAYAYDNVLKGVGFALQNVQLLQHDNPFGGGAGRAKDDFDELASELGTAGDWDN